MEARKRVAMGFVVLAVVGSLTLFWIAFSQPVDLTSPLWFGIAKKEVAAREEATTTTGTKRSASDVVSVAASIDGTAQFSALLESSGVASQLKGRGPYTVFVPTDGAFSLLAPGTISKMTAAQKKRLVQHHVIGRSIDPDALNTGGMPALSGDALNFEISARDNTARVNSSFIIQSYKAQNGMVYLISGVLIPPEARTQ